MNAHWMDVAGVKTRYYTAGSGAPVAVFHGGVAGSRTLAWGAGMWRGTMARLAHAFEMIAVDRPGCGESAAPLTDDAYTLDAGAQHAAAFLEQLGKGPYHLVGHGHGGYLVVRVAIDRPDLVLSCTIAGSDALAPGASRRFVLADAPRPLLSRASLRWVFDQYAFRAETAADAWLDEAFTTASGGSHQAALRVMESGVEDRVVAPALGRGRIAIFRHLLRSGLTMPTLLIWGKNDAIAPLETGRLLLEALARKQARTEMRVINEAGNLVFLEQPAAFERALASFLASVT